MTNSQLDNLALATDAPAILVSNPAKPFLLDSTNTVSLPQPYLPSTPSAPLKPTPLPSPQFSLASADVPALSLRRVREGSVTSVLGDFDDHLEDLTVDWLRNADVTL